MRARSSTVGSLAISLSMVRPQCPWSVYSQTDVGDDEHVRHACLDGADGALHWRVRIVTFDPT